MGLCLPATRAQKGSPELLDSAPRSRGRQTERCPGSESPPWLGKVEVGKLGDYSKSLELRKAY